MRTAALGPKFGQRNPAPAGRSQIKTIPAPVRGLVLNENLVASDPRGARVLTNWYPTETGVRVRKGAARVATISAAATSMLVYRASGAERIFGATASAIHDVTSPGATDTADPAVMTQLTGGAWVEAQMATAGGQFMVAVNGSDDGVIYDGTGLYPWGAAAVSKLDYDGVVTAFTVGETVTGGTSLASATIIGLNASTLYLGAITGGPFQDNEALTSAAGEAVAASASSTVVSATVSGIRTDELDFIWSHKSRLWAVEKDSLSAWYLPAASIGGTATEFSLRGVFQRGGKLMMGATVSSDTGAGPDDRMAFISSEGEVAIYAGSDPSSAATWALEGVYYLGGKPIGRKATMRAGGDVIVGTEVGAVSIIQAVSIDPAALSKAAISRAIEPLWMENSASRSTLPWEMARSISDGWAIVCAPTNSVAERRNFIVNLTTGAWALWTGWDARCFGEFAGRVYAGTGDGAVLLCESGGLDDGDTYECQLAGAPDHVNGLSYYKHIHMCRATFSAAGPFNSRVSLGRDYTVAFPPAPSVASAGDAAAWGVSVFGGATWASGNPATVTTQWRSVERNARVFLPQVQVSIGQSSDPNVELHSIDVLFDIGGSVV